MGRWMKKIENIPKAELTKPTELGFVGFVSAIPEHFEKNSEKFVLDFVTKSCAGLHCEPQRFIDEFLSVEDEQDIIGGDFTAEGLRAHMKNWISLGMPRYSGKLAKM